MLRINPDLRRRLEHAEADAASHWDASVLDNEEDPATCDDDETSTVMPVTSSVNLLEGASGSDFSFERDLEASKVYNRCMHYDCDISFRTSSVRSHAWSSFSDLSLSNVSAVSIIALPVWSRDLCNANKYNFGNSMYSGRTRCYNPNECEPVKLRPALRIHRIEQSKVISLPLPEQTRVTRVIKRSELVHDDTSFWVPSLPLRCIE